MTKKLDANYRENESKFNKLEVPTPGIDEAGKVLMVGEDGKLTYGEGGGSGSGGLVARTFSTVEELYTFLSQYFTSEVMGGIPEVYNIKISPNNSMPNVFQAPLEYLGTGWATAYESHFKEIIITFRLMDIYTGTDYYDIMKAEINATLRRSGSGYASSMYCEGGDIAYENGTTTVTPISEAIPGDFEATVLPYMVFYMTE